MLAAFGLWDLFCTSLPERWTKYICSSWSNLVWNVSLKVCLGNTESKNWVIEFLERTIHYSNNLVPEKRLNKKKKHTNTGDILKPYSYDAASRRIMVLGPQVWRCMYRASYCIVYINQRDAQVFVINLYLFFNCLYMFRTIISPSWGATFNKLYSAIGTCRYVWLQQDVPVCTIHKNLCISLVYVLITVSL